MRDRLIELIYDAKFGENGIASTDRLEKGTIEIIAEHLLENGVIVPPCKVGDVVYAVKENGKIVKGIVESIHQNLVGNEKGRWIVTAWFDNYYADSKKQVLSAEHTYI